MHILEYFLKSTNHIKQHSQLFAQKILKTQLKKPTNITLI